MRKLGFTVALLIMSFPKAGHRAFHFTLPEKDEAIESELPSSRRGDGK
jgi:hypothetical protein